MVAINKEEKGLILERYPNACIVRTQKSRSHNHHYYCEETKKIMQYLRQIRGEEDVKGGGRRGH